MKNLAAILLAALLASVCCHSPAQQLTVECTLHPDKVLFGVPAAAEFVITNKTDKTFYVCGVKDKGGTLTPLRWHAQAYDPGGTPVPFHKSYANFVGEEMANVKHPLAPGESLSRTLALPITDVTIDKLPPGRYELTLTVSYSASDAPGVWEKKTETRAAFELTAPQKEDAAWLDGLRAAILAADKKDLRRPDRQRPLGWYEVLSGPVEGIIPEMVNQHPTSTYAGYALLKKGPATSLQAASVITPEVRDREWYVPVAATPAEREARRKTVREGYETFTHQAHAFLAVHPDFAEAALLRKELAITFFYLDKPQEAWIEVEALSKLEGQWAEEGRKVWTQKERAGKKAP